MDNRKPYLTQNMKIKYSTMADLEKQREAQAQPKKNMLVRDIIFCLITLTISVTMHIVLLDGLPLDSF